MLRRTLTALGLAVSLTAATLVALVSPASASDCNIPSWNDIYGQPYERVGFPQSNAWTTRNSCAIYGLAPGSDPNGYWQLQIRVQDMVDQAGPNSKSGYTDEGQARIQILPYGWGSWGEAYQVTSGWYDGDANSADWDYGDVNYNARGIRTYTSQTFYTPVNGSPWSWAVRMVNQYRHKDCTLCAWAWTDMTPSSGEYLD